MYVCYDIKGIQRFIFSVPKLKCVVGASGLIDEFDREAQQRGKNAGVDWIFSGGGRGAFSCSNAEAAEQFERQLVAAAHAIGVDIRIGLDDSLSQAAHHADRLHPYCPENLEGVPCDVSGLWPSPPGRAHPLVRLRFTSARKDQLGRRVLDGLQHAGLIPDTLAKYQLSFFKNVSPEPDSEDDVQWERDESQAASVALGKRNRWAVVAMDGNDMGRQFQAFEAQREQVDGSEEKTRQWLGAMSSRLKECTEQAFFAALGSVIKQWSLDAEEDLDDCLVEPAAGPPAPTLMLPFRPLILGGDDVILLCHTSYAMQFVERMADEFRKRSREAARNSPIQPLWPATNDELTISAGILYAKVTFPLHLAINYAEKLLGSAKGMFRADPSTTAPTASAVDWDTITDSLVDTPTARRNRELRFRDPELKREIYLTRRPYLLEPKANQPDLKSLEKVKEQLALVPRSVRATILPGLQQPWSERVAFTASLAKGHEFLWNQLREDAAELGTAWCRARQDGPQVTGLPDALLLLDEEHRLNQTRTDD
jgi:hypothetical protein